jgi:hypothetical protein
VSGQRITINANMAEFLGFRRGGKSYGRLNYTCPLDATAAGLGVDVGEECDVFVDEWPGERIARMRLVSRRRVTVEIGPAVEVVWDLVPEPPAW